jgi:four helix bundle protein
MKDSIIREKSFKFGLRIVKLADHLVEKRSYAIADQVLRAGTGIGSNVYEAAVAVSRKEFISKSSIAHKEAHETYYWLMLLRESGKIEKRLADSLISDREELCRILASIIKTSRQNPDKEDVRT